MTKKTIFDFKNYKAYLEFQSEEKGRRSGMKSNIAAAMGSHPAYLSRVMSGQADLSLEQAEKITRFLQLDPEERRYFILLVEEERASTEELKSYFRQQLEEILKQRTVIQKRIPPSQEISDADKSTYYSAWYYPAIHVLLSIPTFKDASSVANHLMLPLRTTQEAIRFLEEIGLIERKKDRWEVTGRHIHVDRSSNLFRQNHSNWHLRAIQTLDRAPSEVEVRYCGVFSLSKADAVLLREHLLKSLGEFLKQVAASPEETAYVYTCDFIPLGSA